MLAFNKRSYERKEELSDEKGNVEADIAADCEYSHGGGNDPRSDFLYGLLVRVKVIRENHLYSLYISRQIEDITILPLLPLSYH